MKGIHNIKELGERRKELRKRATPYEDLLWKKFRDNQLGVKFKRQHSIGGYILDFYCSEKKLIIELDGEIHNTKEAREYDQVRDKFFTDLGYQTIRFKNSEVENDIAEVVSEVNKFLK